MYIPEILVLLDISFSDILFDVRFFGYMFRHIYFSDIHFDINLSKMFSDIYFFFRYTVYIHIYFRYRIGILFLSIYITRVSQ